MSYYDRLQGVLSEQEAPQKGLNQLQSTKEYAEDAFSKAVGDANNIASTQMDDFMKIGAKHYAEHAGIKLMKQYVVKPRMDKLAQAKESLEASKQARIGRLGQETDDLTAGGEARLVGAEDAYRLGDGSVVGESARPSMTSARGTQVQAAGEKVEGKSIDVQGNLIDKETGLTEEEGGRLGEIVGATKDIAGEEVGGIISKVSKGLDFLGPLGEVAQLGVMAVEGIKNAVEAHKEQKEDLDTEQSSIASSTQAGEYIGMSRPNFGSMALPSFDTSKSSAMLQQ